jgi:hypothetical protein
MEWALETGGWNHERVEAIDARDPAHRFWVAPNPFQRGTWFPGVRRMDERHPLRRTTRAELACCASWRLALRMAADRMARDNVEQVLILEDDAGACLAVPGAWPFALDAVVDAADRDSRDRGIPWTLIQLAPTNAEVRRRLHRQWKSDPATCLLVDKEDIRSHGNSAVLVHRRGLSFLIGRGKPDPSARFHSWCHPWAVRPVADKWMYASVPTGSVRVLAFPLFCPDASGSQLHPSDVAQFHHPSRDATLEIWRREGIEALINAQQQWDAIGEIVESTNSPAS